jgi:hypothetical protein
MNTSDPDRLNGREETENIKETDPLSNETTNQNDGVIATKVRVKQSKDQGQVDVVAPDGGYGWVIVFASFWIQFLIAMPMVYGVLYVDLLEAFERSNADTAWPGSIATGLALALGKFPKKKTSEKTIPTLHDEKKVIFN